MTIVDSHQHYWQLLRGDYDWLTPQMSSLYRDFMPQDLLPQLTEHGIAASVLVQAAATEAETRFLFSLARQHPSIGGVVGWVNFEAVDVAARIWRLVVEGEGRLKGLRPMVQDIAMPRWLEQARLDAAFDAMSAASLTFDALVIPSQLDSLERRLRKHPSLRAVLDHGGKPDLAGRSLESWALSIERLARLPNLYCKLSGLVNLAPPSDESVDLDEVTAHLFACFGPERMMWGSDWPVVTERASYGRWLKMARALIRTHAPGREHRVLCANAGEFYRLQNVDCAAPAASGE